MKIMNTKFMASSLALAVACGLTINEVTAEMVTGKPDLQSVGTLAFGPDGVIFVADPQGASVFAIETAEPEGASSDTVKIEAVNQKAAALLGTTADQIMINDLAVNPVSHMAYLSITRGDMPVILRAGSDGELKLWSLDNVNYSKVELPSPAEGDNARSGRRMSVTDMSFVDGKLVVAGLSNEEFSSRLLAIPYPFESVEAGTGVEIFHANHNRLETNSPIRAFAPYELNGTSQLFAAYTCTPLVQLSMDDLKPGTQVTGKTIAELGNRNQPLDMFVYNKDGKDYILMANNSRGIMKITTENLEDAEALTSRVEETAGLAYETISSWQDIFQLEQLDDGHALVIQGPEDGAQNLVALSLP